MRLNWRQHGRIYFELSSWRTAALLCKLLFAFRCTLFNSSGFFFSYFLLCCWVTARRPPKKLVRVKWSSWQDIHSCVLLLFLDRCCLPESHLCITKYQSIDMLKCCISTAISATLFSYFRNEWMNGLKACSNANFNGCQMNCEGLIN